MNKIQEQTTKKTAYQMLEIGRSSGNQKNAYVTNDSRSYTEVDQNVENLM